MMKKISCLSSDHHQDMKKKILYLKKIERWQKKKNPRQIFVDKIFSMFVKNQQNKICTTSKRFFLRPLLLQLPEALLKTKKKFEIIFEEENFLVIFAI